MGNKVQVTYPPLTATDVTVVHFPSMFSRPEAASLVPSLRVSQLRAEVVGFIPL